MTRNSSGKRLNSARAFICESVAMETVRYCEDFWGNVRELCDFCVIFFQAQPETYHLHSRGTGHVPYPWNHFTQHDDPQNIGKYSWGYEGFHLHTSKCWKALKKFKPSQAILGIITRFNFEVGAGILWNISQLWMSIVLSLFSYIYSICGLALRIFFHQRVEVWWNILKIFHGGM